MRKNLLFISTNKSQIQWKTFKKINNNNNNNQTKYVCVTEKLFE